MKRKRKRWYPKPGKQIHPDVFSYRDVVREIESHQEEWPMSRPAIERLVDQLDVLWARLDMPSKKLLIYELGPLRGVPDMLDPRGTSSQLA